MQQLQVQVAVLLSYLHVKAPLTGLPVNVFSSQVNQLTILSPLTFIPTSEFHQAVKKRPSRMICSRQIKNKCISSVLILKVGTGTCLEILLSEVKGCMGAVTSSSLWLFVPVSHQSASVKASSAGGFTPFLQILPPPSAWLFYSPLIVYMLNTLLVSSRATCTEWEDAKLPLLECKCEVIHFKEKTSLVCDVCAKENHILHPRIWWIYASVCDQSKGSALLCFSWKSGECICFSVCKTGRLSCSGKWNIKP